MKFLGEITRLFHGKGKKAQEGEQIQQRLEQVGKLHNQGATDLSVPDHNTPEAGLPPAVPVSDAEKIRLEIEDANSQLNDSAGSTRQQIADRIAGLRATLATLEEKGARPADQGTTMKGPGGFELPAQDAVPPTFTRQPGPEAPKVTLTTTTTPDKAA